MRQPVLVMVLLLLRASTAGAQTPPFPLVTDRPDFTESPLVVAPARVQLEAGYTLSRDGEADAHTLGEVLVRIGVRDRVEARLGLESYSWIEGPGKDDSGFEDPSLGVKLALVGEPESPGLRPAVALLIGATVPGPDSFGEGAWQPEGTLAAAWDASRCLALGSNVGYARASEGGERFDQVSASLAVGIEVTERIGAYVEVYGLLPAAPEANDAAVANGGVTYLVHPDLQFDARVGAGLTSEAPDFFIGVGAARRW